MGANYYEHFSSILRDLPKAIASDSEELCGDRFFSAIDELTKFGQSFPPEKYLREMDLFRRKCLPLILQSSFGYYVFSKPRGYAGDFVTQEMIWHGRTGHRDDKYIGITYLGKLLSAFTFDMQNCKANEFRVKKLKSIFSDTTSLKRVASIGCGSCIEWWDFEPPDQIGTTAILFGMDIAVSYSVMKPLRRIDS